MHPRCRLTHSEKELIRSDWWGFDGLGCPRCRLTHSGSNLLTRAGGSYTALVTLGSCIAYGCVARRITSVTADTSGANVSSGSLGAWTGKDAWCLFCSARDCTVYASVCRFIMLASFFLLPAKFWVVLIRHLPHCRPVSLLDMCGTLCGGMLCPTITCS